MKFRDAFGERQLGKKHLFGGGGRSFSVRSDFFRAGHQLAVKMRSDADSQRKTTKALISTVNLLSSYK